MPYGSAIIGMDDRTRCSPEAVDRDAQGPWRSRRLRFGRRRVSSQASGGKAWRGSAYGLAVARAHEDRPMGHPRVQPQFEARLAGMAGGILASHRSPAREGGLGPERSGVSGGLESYAEAGGGSS